MGLASTQDNSKEISFCIFEVLFFHLIFIAPFFSRFATIVRVLANEKFDRTVWVWIGPTLEAHLALIHNFLLF